MSNKTLKVTIPADLRAHLEDIAAQMERTVEEVTHQALSEFIENWGDYMRTVQALESEPEERPVLRAVND